MKNNPAVCLSVAALVLVGAFLFGCGGTGTGSILHTPKFLVVTNSANGPANPVDVFSINATTGALAKVAGSPFGSPPLAAAANSFLWGTVVHPNGHWVYLAEQFDPDIQGIDLSASSGTPTALGAEVQNSHTIPWVDAIKINPKGTHLYAADGNGNVSSYKIDQTTGALTAKGPTAVAGATNLQALVALESFGYVLDAGTKQIFGAARDSNGNLTPIAGFPIAVASANSLLTIATDRSASFLYVFTSGTDIFGYSINQTTGALTLVAGFPIHISGATVQASFSPDNKFVYTAENTAVRILSFNSSTGALTEIAGSPVAAAAGTRPNAVVADPSNQFVYVGDCNNPQVFAYMRNQTTGALTAVAGSPFASSGGVACGLNVTF